jgi:hypothetical protein
MAVGGGVEDHDTVMWILPTPLDRPAVTTTPHSSGRLNGCGMVWVNGVFPVKLPEEPAWLVNWVQLTLQLISAWSGLDVTEAVIVIGLLGDPLTAQVARVPDWLHEPIVPAFATVVLAATPPNASMQVTATPVPRRRKLRTVNCPFLLELAPTGWTCQRDGRFTYAGAYELPGGGTGR